MLRTSCRRWLMGFGLFGLACTSPSQKVVLKNPTGTSTGTTTTPKSPGGAGDQAASPELKPAATDTGAASDATANTDTAAKTDTATKTDAGAAGTAASGGPGAPTVATGPGTDAATSPPASAATGTAVAPGPGAGAPVVTQGTGTGCWAVAAGAAGDDAATDQATPKQAVAAWNRCADIVPAGWTVLDETAVKP